MVVQAAPDRPNAEEKEAGFALARSTSLEAQRSRNLKFDPHRESKAFTGADFVTFLGAGSRVQIKKMQDVDLELEFR